MNTDAMDLMDYHGLKGLSSGGEIKLVACRGLKFISSMGHGFNSFEIVVKAYPRALILSTNAGMMV